MVTSSLQVFPHPRGRYNHHQISGRFRISTILLRASANFKVSHRYPHRWDITGASPGLVPFSAFIVRRDKHNSNCAAPRPRVFATSRQRRRPQRLAGLFRPAGTPRVLTFRVLPTIDSELSPVPDAPSLLPSLHGILPCIGGARHAPGHPGITPRPDLAFTRPLVTPKCDRIPSWD